MAKKKSGALIFDSGIEGPVNGEISDASTYNLTTLDPGFGSGLPDLATPGETIRGKTVYDYIGDWDPPDPATTTC